MDNNMYLSNTNFISVKYMTPPVYIFLYVYELTYIYIYIYMYVRISIHPYIIITLLKPIEMIL